MRELESERVRGHRALSGDGLHFLPPESVRWWNPGGALVQPCGALAAPWWCPPLSLSVPLSRVLFFLSLYIYISLSLTLSVSHSLSLSLSQSLTLSLFLSLILYFPQYCEDKA